MAPQLSWYGGPYFPFWLEESPWPFVHYLLPVALYVATQNLGISLFLLYVWEAFEQVLSSYNAGMTFTEERWDDSWIGDPLVGILGVVTAAIGHAAFGWTAAMTADGPSIWWRALGFAIQAGSSVIFGANKPPAPNQQQTVRPRVLAFTAIHVIVIVCVYAPTWSASPALLGMSVAWIVVAVLQGLVAFRVCSDPDIAAEALRAEHPNVAYRRGNEGTAVFARVFSAGLLVLIAALVGAIATRPWL